MKDGELTAWPTNVALSGVHVWARSLNGYYAPVSVIRDPQQPARERTFCAAVRSSVYGGKPSWQPTADQVYIRESWLSGCVVQSKVNLAYGIAL